MEQLVIWLNEKRGRKGILAAALGITSGALSQWTQVPHERVRAVSEFTGIPPHELRPDLADIFGPAPQEAAE